MELNTLSCATVGFQLQDILARAFGQIERHCEGIAGSVEEVAMDL